MQEASAWQVAVDFNRLARGGKVKVPLKRFTNPVNIDDVYLLVDENENMITPGVAREIDQVKGFVYFQFRKESK